MDISTLTIGEAREIATLFAYTQQNHPYRIGANYFVRTVTHHLTGKLVEVGAQELVLENAAWIPSDGRFAQAVAKAEFDEVEPFPDGRVIIGRAALIDAVEISTVPRSQK